MFFRRVSAGWRRLGLVPQYAAALLSLSIINPVVMAGGDASLPSPAPCPAPGPAPGPTPGPDTTRARHDQGTAVPGGPRTAVPGGPRTTDKCPENSP